jgi:hypothetical protein
VRGLVAQPGRGRHRPQRRGRLVHRDRGGGERGPGGGSDSTSAQIAVWVEAHFTATTVSGQTVYDLTA